MQFQRTSILWLFVLAWIWTAEVVFIQEFSASDNSVLPAETTAKYIFRRLILDAGFCTALVFLLPRRWLIACFAFSALHAIGVLTFATYFGKPLSWPVLANQWREGIQVIDHAFAVIPVFSALALVIMLGIKILYLHRFQYPSDRKFARLCLGIIIGFMSVAYGYTYAFVHKPIEHLKISTPEYVYGYSLAWVAEAVSLRPQRLHELAMEAAAKTSDQLLGIDPLPVLDRHVAIIQVESLDYNIVSARVNGQLVMPFLNRLSQQGLFYPVEPIHDIGSCDSDFTTLTGVRANGKIVPYRIVNFPYEDTLPQLARSEGYETAAWHGFSGTFFERRPAFEKMGFDNILFLEDFKQLQYPVTRDAIDDRLVLRASAAAMRQATQPTMHFVITYTSHGPYDRLPKESRDFFPNPKNLAEAYVNSMRYFDRVLEEYVLDLPEDTTVVLYGDHNSGVAGYNEESNLDKKVPWLIYSKYASMAENQASKSQIDSGKLQLSHLDLVTHMRRMFTQRRSVESLATVAATE